MTLRDGEIVPISSLLLVERKGVGAIDESPLLPQKNHLKVYSNPPSCGCQYKARDSEKREIDAGRGAYYFTKKVEVHHPPRAWW